MNIAFTSILIFIILSPGFIFKIAYNSSILSVKDPNRNIINELTWAIIPSIVFHTFSIFIVELSSEYYIDFKQLGNLILGVTDKNVVNDSFIQIGQFVYSIFWYNIILLITSYGLGHLSRYIVRHFKLDRQFSFFRFSNKWHYILEGECLDFPNVPDEYEDISYMAVDVLCKVNGVSVIYIGEVFNYYVDSKGDLEAVHLRYPIRRLFSDDSTSEGKYYEIPSKFLVIPSADIININIKYFNYSIEESEISEEERNQAIELTV